MNISDYITNYESKTGDTFSIPPGFQLAFDSAKLLLTGGTHKWTH